MRNTYRTMTDNWYNGPRRKSAFLVAIAAALLIAPLAKADVPDTLTLGRALELAHQHNLHLKSAESSIEVAKLSHAELMKTKLPQIQFEASAVYAPSSGHFGYDPAISNGGQYAGQVVAKQSLYDGGIRGLRSQQIGIDIERVNKEYRLTERDLVFSVKTAFVEVLRSAQEIRLREESVRQLDEYLGIVKQLSRGGNANYTDVLKTELQLSGARIAHQNSVEAHATAKYALAELLGGTIDTSFTAAGSLDASGDVAPSTFTGDAADSTANLDLAIARLEIEHTQLEVELARSERAPVVSLVGDAGLLTSGDNLRLPYDERAGIFGFSVGLLLEIPLVTWGATDLRVQQKQITANNSHYQTELLHRSLVSEEQKTRLHLVRGHERLRAIRESYKSADENFLLTKSKYTGGGTLSLEVLSAQQLLTETRLSELQTMADIEVLSARLEQLTAH